MVRRILLAGLVGAVAAGETGCNHCCRRQGRDTAPRGGTFIPPPPGGIPATLPPGDTGLPPSTPPPPGGPGADLPPPSVPDTSRSFRPDPAKPGTQLLLPDPLPGASSAAPKSGTGFLGNPVVPTGGDLPPRQQSPARTAGAAAPADGVPGVPGFAAAAPGAATGRKPAVEGFDALKARGYRTAVYLHAPGEDVSAAKDLAERTGLAFAAVPVSPATLGSAFERFKAVVGDRSARPVFVFDDTGVRAGSLWYLYFRTVDALADDAARVRAAPLGLRDAGDEATKFWVAIQDYLAKR